MRFLRIFPAVCAMISCGWLTSFTRNVALGRSSVTMPSNSNNSSFAILALFSFGGCGECTETGQKQAFPLPEKCFAFSTLPQGEGVSGVRGRALLEARADAAHELVA